MELDRELTRRRMESVTSYDAFIDLALKLGLVEETVFFDFVFTHAISGGRVES